MSDKPTSPIRQTDDEARALAASILTGARIAALGLWDADAARPHVTRIAFVHDPDLGYFTLVSDLSKHASLMKQSPVASLLIGEAPDKGDPLAFPRLTLAADAAFIPRDARERVAMRALWLERHPKAALYIDFGDFNFVRFTPLGADLNGGFGKAFRLCKTDLP
ncbi:pyridoxamine 5-phosphate oxidase [Celeribacter arenosi]|uniref:Pyridoxamine 5'-phosphate oxidase family protein n=1 Tax=Celeribacter arenosi TaxID=792649 RepID=A0ABP7K7B7_9RHOB